MLRAFFSSATGMRAQELLIDNTANNLANVNTNGFKRSQLDFADLVYASYRPPGATVATGLNSPIGLQIGSGVRTVGNTKVFTPGMIQDTGNPTDVAIEGDGFFGIQMPNGELRYSRDGAFHLDANGVLRTGDGFAVDGNITIPDGVSMSNVTVASDGTVSYTQGETSTTVGTIGIYRFRNPAGLSSEGGNLYAATAASGAALPATVGTNGFLGLRQAFLERSNVEVVTELVSLITAQRAYEINARAIRAGDEMLSNTSQIVR